MVGDIFTPFAFVSCFVCLLSLRFPKNFLKKAVRGFVCLFFLVDISPLLLSFFPFYLFYLTLFNIPSHLVHTPLLSLFFPFSSSSSFFLLFLFFSSFSFSSFFVPLISLHLLLFPLYRRFISFGQVGIEHGWRCGRVYISYLFSSSLFFFYRFLLGVAVEKGVRAVGGGRG